MSATMGGLTSREQIEQEITELRERLSLEEAQRSHTPTISTARNAPTRQELLTRTLTLKSRISQLQARLGVVAMLEELRGEPRIASAELEHLWLIQKPGRDAQLCTRAWNLVLVLTDGSRHKISFPDERVTAEDVLACVGEALQDD